MPTNTPNTGNYHIGKGVVTFTPSVNGVSGANRDLGNCSSFVYTPQIEKKDHFSSRQAIKKKDFTAITQAGAQIKLVLDEIVAENVAIFALASTAASVSDGNLQLQALSQTQFLGRIYVNGTNSVGNQVDFEADVSFIPSGDFKFITDTDDFTTIELLADVVADSSGNYGTFTIRSQ